MRVFNKWAGNPKGTPEDPKCCVAEVWDGHFHFYQCSRKRGHGPDGLYCKQHAKMKENGSFILEGNNS